MTLILASVGSGYGPIDVVHDIDLMVGDGETVALLGPNGAGKSTLLAAITGTIRRRSGSIRLDEDELLRADPHRIVSAGLRLVPEGRLIFGPLTVRDNLRLGAIKLRRGEGHSVEERFGNVYKLFPRLQERADQLAGTLSGGEQQMVAIGRALMSAPRVLLLDEPFLGLAPMIVDEIRRALEALRAEGLTILLVEQKLDIALALAARAYVMVKGRIVLEGAAEEILARPDLGELYFSVAGDAG